MAIWNKDYVIQQMRDTDFMYFKVYDGAGEKAPLVGFYEPKDKNGDIDTAVTKLEDILDNIETGTVTVVLRPVFGADVNANQSRKYLTYLVKLNNKQQQPGVGNNANPPIPMPRQDNSAIESLRNQIHELDKKLLEQQHKSQFDELKNMITQQNEERNREREQWEREKRELERDIDELLDELENPKDEGEEDNSIGSTMEKTMTDLTKRIVEGLPVEEIGKSLGQKAVDYVKGDKVPAAETLAGPPPEMETNTATVEEVDKQKKLCGQACGRLLKKDGAAGEHLILLAELAELSPNMYLMGIKQVHDTIADLKKISSSDGK